MNINDLTLGEVRELTKILNTPSTEQSDLYSRYVGKYVICRTRNEGVNAGKVITLDETGVILEDARRLYYHRPKNKELSWYEGVALDGLSEDSKIGAPVEKLIVEDYSLTVCTKEAEKNIKEKETNEQN